MNNLATTNRLYILRSLACVLPLLACGLLGCGGGGVESPPIGAVSGKVTFEGKPVTKGVVNFNATGFGAQATLADDGSYTMTSHHGNGIPLGSYKVSIAPPTPETKPGTADLVPQGEFPDIPQKYRNQETSGFTAEVKEGSNPFDFEMKK